MRTIIKIVESIDGPFALGPRQRFEGRTVPPWCVLAGGLTASERGPPELAEAPSVDIQTNRSDVMDKDRIKGAAEQVKGTVRKRPAR